MFTIIAVIVLCGLMQFVFQYPKQVRSFLLTCLGFTLPYVRKYFPKVATYLEYIVVKYSQPDIGNRSCTPSIFTNPSCAPKYVKHVNVPCSPQSPCDELDTPPRSSCPLDGPYNEDLWQTSNKLNLPTVPKSFDDQLNEYEETNSTRVIFINHEVTSLYGIISQRKSLNDEDAQKFVDIMREVPEDQHITLVINTNGGSLKSAEVIIHSLLNHKGKTVVYIPYGCMSAGTLIALACDEIYMDKNAYCGTIDPQVYGFSVTSIIDFAKYYKDSTSWVGDIAKFICTQAKSSVERVRKVLNQINERRMSGSADLDTIHDELLSGKYNHDTPLFVDTMQQFVPTVKEGVPVEMMALYNGFVDKSKKKSPYSFL